MVIVLKKRGKNSKMKMVISSKNTNKYAKEERKMIIMDLKIDNFLAFKNFHMNMSYPKKIVDSYIAHEYLQERTNFRYKKVNILMGGNATGKTSIGKVLMCICNFIKNKEANSIVSKVGDTKKEASITVDFIGHSLRMYRLDIKVKPSDEEGELPKVFVCKRVTDIGEKDRYETCAAKIDRIPLEYNEDYAEELEKIDPIGWMFTYPSDMGNKAVEFPQDPSFLKVMEYTLKSLDPAIKSVEKSKEVVNTFIVHMQSGDLLVQDGEVIKKNILSSGTKAGIDIASLIYSIYKGECGFYYCDEKFSYIHSELEKAFLNVMIHGLRNGEQLFFTTHNSDIMDLPLPKHSYIFLKKDIHNEEEPIKCVYASDYLKRNTDSIRRAIDNDLFATSPNLEYVYEIAEISEFSKEEC